MKGKKLDAGKPRWSLVPMREMKEVVKVLTVGAVKYADDNWKSLPNLRERYFSAALRHIAAMLGRCINVCCDRYQLLTEKDHKIQ